MVIGYTTEATTIILCILIFIEVLYFYGMQNFQYMTLLDIIIVGCLNLGLIMLITYDLPSSYNPKKPKSPFISVGSSMDESIWALWYDYSTIVDRFDRNNLRI